LNEVSLTIFFWVISQAGFRTGWMVVILDSARWRHAKALTTWLTKQQEISLLDFLPPYSPRLNHIERLWKLTRKLFCLCVARRQDTLNRYFSTLN